MRRRSMRNKQRYSLESGNNSTRISSVRSTLSQVEHRSRQRGRSHSEKKHRHGGIETVQENIQFNQNNNNTSHSKNNNDRQRHSVPVLLDEVNGDC